MDVTLKNKAPGLVETLGLKSALLLTGTHGCLPGAKFETLGLNEAAT